MTPTLICTCGEALTRRFNGGVDNPLYVEPCAKCWRNLRVLLTQHRVVIQRLKRALDQMRGVAECAPQEYKEQYDFVALDDLFAEADRVIMLSEKEVRGTP